MATQQHPLSRWGGRLAGFGLMAAAAFPLAFSEVEPAEAQSPVCFTVYGKCFCVDFFLTEMRDMAWGQAQQKITSLYDDFLNQELDTQISTIISAVESPEDLLDWRGYADDAREYAVNRSLSAMGVSPQEVATGDSVLGDYPELVDYLKQPQGDARDTVYPRAQAVAYGLADPGSMAPYRMQSDAGNTEPATQEEVVKAKAWADRMMVVPPAPASEDITPEKLASMPAGEIERQYLDTRVRVVGTIAQDAMLAPFTHEKAMTGLRKQHQQLQTIRGASPSVADTQSGLVLAEVLKGYSLIERIESHLRQERVMGAMIAMKQDLAALKEVE